ncbi:Hypothetical predicted protein, partial [Paramuricea clavata]
KCRDRGVVPQGLRVRLLKDEFKVGNVTRMKKRLKTTRVQTRIKDIRRKLYYVNQQKRDILMDLKETFTQDDFHWVEQVIRVSENRENESVKKRQVRKFDALIKEKEDLENKNRQLLEDQERMNEERKDKE